MRAHQRKPVNCDFFRIIMPEGALAFDVALTNAIAARTVPQRNVETSDGFHRVENLRRGEGGRLAGLFLRLKTDTDAVTAGLEEEGIQGLQLRPGEVLTEFFGFLYVPEFRVIVIHRNRDAGRQGRLESYAESLTGINPIRLSVVIAGNALTRLRNMGHMTKAHLVIANPENLDGVEDDGPAGKIIEAAHDSGAALIEVNISVGNTRRFLNNAFVQSVLGLIGVREDGVKSATVTGEVDGEVVLIDLIKDAMRETVVVEGEGRLTPDAVFLALGQAYERMEPEIRRIYREPND